MTTLYELPCLTIDERARDLGMTGVDFSLHTLDITQLSGFYGASVTVPGETDPISGVVVRYGNGDKHFLTVEYNFFKDLYLLVRRDVGIKTYGEAQAMVGELLRVRNQKNNGTTTHTY